MDLPEPEWVREAASRKDQGLGEKGKAEGLAQEWEGMDMQEPEWLKGGCVLLSSSCLSCLLVDLGEEACREALERTRSNAESSHSCGPLRRPLLLLSGLPSLGSRC